MDVVAKDLERLALLWQERKKQSSLSDYPLGPGDVLQISVADLKEISEERVRISGEGKIELPLLGVIQAAGSTESQRENCRRQAASPPSGQKAQRTNAS